MRITYSGAKGPSGAAKTHRKRPYDGLELAFDLLKRGASGRIEPAAKRLEVACSTRWAMQADLRQRGSF